MTPATATEDSLSAEEIGQASLLIEQTRNYLLGSIRFLPPAQWTARSRPDCWSVAQIFEHILVVQEFIIGSIRGQFGAAPPPPADHDPKTVDTVVFAGISSRVIKFPSPPSIHPRSELDRTTAEQRLTANCAALNDLLTSVAGLRRHATEAPPLRAISAGAYSFMDGYQWIIACALHTERHTKQILEGIAAATLPAEN